MKKVVQYKNEVTKNFNKWFSTRALKILNYQRDILLNKIPNSLETNKLPTVLAACPAAGKTIMAIYIIEWYLIQNPGSRVLILTHGTTVLRTQFIQELEIINPAYNYSLVAKGKKLHTIQSPVIIALPQTLNCVDKLAKFDLVVVDEAHQFYFADMVQKILNKVKPKHQLLLTGTPSEFIAKKFPIIPISLSQLMDYGMVEDLKIEIASSAYDFRNKDYNEYHELKPGTKIKASHTNKTLSTLIASLKTNIRGKTMIACQSIVQAKQINKYLQQQNYNTALSTNDHDKESIEIIRFKQEKKCQILIVVYRGILGFNLPELQTVIDMTVSQNINRIFQLLARVVRKHPKGLKKKYIKVAPKYLQEYFNYIMTAVMCLTDEKYFTKFNGNNFMDLEIPVKMLTSKAGLKSQKNKANFKFVDYAGLPAISFFKTILKEGSKISYARLQDVRSLLSSKVHACGFWTFEKCFEDALQYNTKGEWSIKSHTAYAAACKFGWLEKCSEHMVQIYQPRGYWTKQKCKDDALRFTSRNEWRIKNHSAYIIALRNKWMDECCKHMISFTKPMGYWTLQKCKEDAEKYKTIREWKQNSGSAYGAAYKNGWMDACTHHMTRIMKRRGYWTLENCQKDALRFKRLVDWQHKSPTAYCKAWKFGWIENCNKHMINRRTNKTPKNSQKDLVLE